MSTFIFSAVLATLCSTFRSAWTLCLSFPVITPPAVWRIKQEPVAPPTKRHIAHANHGHWWGPLWLCRISKANLHPSLAAFPFIAVFHKMFPKFRQSTSANCSCFNWTLWGKEICNSSKIAQEEISHQTRAFVCLLFFFSLFSCFHHQLPHLGVAQVWGSLTRSSCLLKVGKKIDILKYRKI